MNNKIRLKALKKVKKKISNSTEYAKQFLINAGIVNKNGKLRKWYRE